MNELITDIKSIEIETLNNLKLSKASNTIRAYKSDFKDFAMFCTKNGFKSLPAEPKIVSLYLTYLSSTRKISTLKRTSFKRSLHRYKTSNYNRKFDGYKKKEGKLSEIKKTYTTQRVKGDC